MSVKPVTTALNPTTKTQVPVISIGKSDSYVKCSGCGSNISIQYSNCPACNTVNPNVNSL